MDLEFSVKTLLYMSENSALTSSQQSQHSESTPIENNQNNDYDFDYDFDFDYTAENKQEFIKKLGDE